MMRWIQRFFATEAAGGAVMLLATALALLIANSAQHGAYEQFVHLNIGQGLVLGHAVSEFLMPVFFLMIGIELRHEMTDGALATRSQKLLPLIAALGGIAVPALIFLAVTRTYPAYQNGWAIPTATDIAFAIGVLSLVGRAVPPAAKIFLLAIAIYDDLAAILIIALFYSHGMALLPLLGALALLGLLLFLRWRGIHSALVYLVIGVAMGGLLHAAGVHTTVAGMLTGLILPRGTAERMMAWLHPLVSFAILPLFAFVSAGVSLADVSLQSFTHPLALGIILALCFGKQIGIFGATFLAVRFGVATKPEGASWRVLHAIALLAGIGFTMSLLIGQLAFPGDPDTLNIVTFGVLAASVIAAIGGAVFIRLACRTSARLI